MDINNIEKNMVSFYNTLSEKDRRRYAAIEAQKHGYGGIIHMSILFNCDEIPGYFVLTVDEAKGSNMYSV